jgi:hypothetical protein
MRARTAQELRDGTLQAEQLSTAERAEINEIFGLPLTAPVTELMAAAGASETLQHRYANFAENQQSLTPEEQQQLYDALVWHQVLEPLPGTLTIKQLRRRIVDLRAERYAQQGAST